MAKKHRSFHKSLTKINADTPRPKRDFKRAADFSTDLVLQQPDLVKHAYTPLVFEDLQEDRRLNRVVSSSKIVERRSDIPYKWHNYFTQKNQVPVCIRRRQRRRLLFKIGFAGRGRVKYAKWTEMSRVSCKG